VGGVCRVFVLSYVQTWFSSGNAKEIGEGTQERIWAREKQF